MYPRWLYVGLLSVGIGTLQFAAAFGAQWQVYLSFAVALLLGAVVFYQGERRVTPGPIFSNFAIAVVLGTVACVLLTGGLLVWFLDASWDLALWQGGLFVWEAAVGIDFALVMSFFIVGLVESLS